MCVNLRSTITAQYLFFLCFCARAWLSVHMGECVCLCVRENACVHRCACQCVNVSVYVCVHLIFFVCFFVFTVMVTGEYFVN